LTLKEILIFKSVIKTRFVQGKLNSKLYRKKGFVISKENCEN